MKRAVQLLSVVALLNVALATKVYDEQKGLEAVYYSGTTHCNEQSILSWNCGEACDGNSGTKEVSIVANSDRTLYGFTAYNSQRNHIVLSFRGSANIENWISNIDFFTTTYKPYPQAQVHRGFYQAYSSIADQVISQIEALISNHPTADLFVTGHSLGGALATFAALDIKQKVSNFANDFYFYSLGSPRCGDKVFSDYLMTIFPDGKYSRLTHYNDVVPHLPLDGMGFYHGGNEVWYKNDGAVMGYLECEAGIGSEESKYCSNSFGYGYSTAAHGIYVGKVVGGMCTSGTEEPTLFLSA